MRVGPKGKGEFRRIGWDEAIDRITTKFAEIAASPDGPQAILPYSYAGTMGKLQGSSLDRRFFHRLGASLLDRTICATAGAAGCDVTLGTRAVIDPEAVRQSRYIINWGSNTSVTNMHLWTIMHQARKDGARIVTIDPFRCKTAERSDWWLPIRPGTDAALALGIMHVLFRDRLTDDDYLQRYCLGTEQLRQRVLDEYSPSKVARITGVPEADIERLAHEYGTVKPALIRLNYGMQRHGGGGMAVRTICCLPAVIGAWRLTGGGALLSTSKTYPFDAAALERPDLIPPGTRTINMVQLAEALEGKLPGPAGAGHVRLQRQPRGRVPRSGPRSCRSAARGPVHRRPRAVPHRHRRLCRHPAAGDDAARAFRHSRLLRPSVRADQRAGDRARWPRRRATTTSFASWPARMGFEPELFDVSDEDLAAQALGKQSERCVADYPPRARVCRHQPGASAA